MLTYTVLTYTVLKTLVVAVVVNMLIQRLISCHTSRYLLEKHLQSECDFTTLSAL